MLTRCLDDAGWPQEKWPEAEAALVAAAVAAQWQQSSKNPPGGMNKPANIGGDAHGDRKTPRGDRRNGPRGDLNRETGSDDYL